MLKNLKNTLTTDCLISVDTNTKLYYNTNNGKYKPIQNTGT